VTPLRQTMIDELVRRNYSEGRARAYLRSVKAFATRLSLNGVLGDAAGVVDEMPLQTPGRRSPGFLPEPGTKGVDFLVVNRPATERSNFGSEQKLRVARTNPFLCNLTGATNLRKIEVLTWPEHRCQFEGANDESGTIKSPVVFNEVALSF